MGQIEKMEEIRSALTEILREMHPELKMEDCDALVSGKVLDSFDMVTLISEIHVEFDVTITADKIIPENFDSVDALSRLILGLMDED